jgi:hypothetical protein
VNIALPVASWYLVTMRIACTVAVTVAALAAQPARASACQCTDRAPKFVLPRDGATSVPTNARVLISAEMAGAARWAAADATAPLPALAIAPMKPGVKGKKPTPGKPVEVLVSSMLSEAWGTVFVIVPKKPLVAKTLYALVKPGEKKGTFDVITTFTTGETADTQPPVFGGLEHFTALIAYQRKLSDCDGDPPSEQLTWRLGDVSDDMTAKGDLIRILYVQKKGEQRTIRMIEPWDLEPLKAVTDNRCDPFHPVLKVGDEVCGIMEAIDLAGNASGGAVEKCMAVRGL